MTKDHKHIGCQIPDGEFEDMEREATAPPFLGNLSDYLRSILRGRHAMTITVSTDVDRLKMFYDIKVEHLQTENTKLLDRLTDINKSTGLAGLDMKKGKLKEHDDDIEGRLRETFARERMEENHKNLVEQHRLLVERHKELEKENQELASGAATEEKIQKYVELGSTALGNLLGSSPMLQERIAGSGLGKIVFGGGADALPASLTSEQQADLTVGTAIRQDFQGDDRTMILQTLRFLNHNRKFLQGIVDGLAFQTFMRKSQQSHQEAA